MASHFDTKGKEPSVFTASRWSELKKSLPFEDERDFEEAKKGFIAEPPYKQIMADAGHVAWDMGKYEFLCQGQDFQSIHPSLQRQAVLNMAYGLFEVLPGKIYQVRGFDLANITFIRSNAGWIAMDVLTCKETARAACELLFQHVERLPVVAIIYSHSHADHFGGARGVVDEADVKSGKVQVIAPVGFLEHAVSENVYAGTAMNRRLFYQYGVLLPPHCCGHVDQSIGKNVAKGSTGLIAPTRYIVEDIEELTVDGVRMIFQNTPGTEAPAEMNTYFPEWKAFWAAENITGTIHNIYTLRGALVRDALEWSRQISRALYLFGMEADLMFASHSWPRFGNARVQEVMRAQRDTYAHLNNGVLHLANKGVTINQVHNVYQVPKSLQQQWAARSYHGSVEHNSRAVVNRYLGYWDGNPTTLIPLSPEDSAPLFVEMMGGAGPILKKGKQLFEEGKYKLGMEILNKLVYAEPHNPEAKELLADFFEQIGYQQESPSVRNSFLAAALELRNGLPAGQVPNTANAEMIAGMDVGLWLDYLGIRLDPNRAEGLRPFKLTLTVVLEDGSEETYVVELSNSTLTNVKGFRVPAGHKGLSLNVNRRDIQDVMCGTKTLIELIDAGQAHFEGDISLLRDVATCLVQFDMKFAIMPGTLPDVPQKNGAQLVSDSGKKKRDFDVDSIADSLC
uniref:Metallo-beta-lactamase domain-containing protein n=1 Tax=Chromera velia CCMP2878 TaxID=1169474 RepID=A0A0G4HBS2_9ALVE|mmetsp:Transcript_14777/g.29815  ORF Transcript_14777/g.29815 Transcript_14777/m.29815 type:complete len:679 (-) Transcript_14777:1168-3204(-)|eukprot:Cvel_25895.t1-p1 / transcript=Cvel_25895.t1 / gene=Cvel_25895 / organism=Chromera_velia_CCMP2878 / gene_product=Alkyl/aryl-sulfatase BDS1, putative / transcript_product=Alkyl/aryl-sulfatase BDS1, putative / location=Cvel_scaffold2991:14133-19729(-) / protein_length=678 / sequence_SO=supercontig / SO=protein_coding / is_pseudo=false